MPGADEYLGLGGQRMVSAVLFMGAGTNMYDAYSAVMSSPWSTEKFSEDSNADKMAYRYVKHAVIIASIYSVGGAMIAGSWWPILGGSLAGGYMFWLYHQAICRARQNRTSISDEFTLTGSPGGW